MPPTCVYIVTDLEIPDGVSLVSKDATEYRKLVVQQVISYIPTQTWSPCFSPSRSVCVSLPLAAQSSLNLRKHREILLMPC